MRNIIRRSIKCMEIYGYLSTRSFHPLTIKCRTQQLLSFLRNTHTHTHSRPQHPIVRTRKYQLCCEKLFPSLRKPAVLVPYHSCNKLPLSLWLQTTQIYYFLEVRVKNQGVAGHLESIGLPFHFLNAPRFFYLVPPQPSIPSS